MARPQHRLLDIANPFDGDGASGVEATTRWGVERARDLALDQMPGARAVGVWHRDGGEQRLGVGMERLAVEGLPVG